MIHVAVIAITYRRPDGLIKLLRALETQQCGDPVRRAHLTAVVVDNDSECSAAASVEAFKSMGTLAVRYVVEPLQGIPLARNAGIAAVPIDAEFLCFIDDDEWPGPTWIDELLKTQRATCSDCVHGAVLPVYPERTSKWLIESRIFESWRFDDQARLKMAHSNNVMLSTAFIRRTGLRFEERMRMSGGSDYLFFRQAVALGMRIVWSAAASVYEDVLPNRLRLRWILQRQYRLGNTFSVSERITGSWAGRAIWILKGLARMGLGIGMLPAVLFSPYYGMRSVVHLLRGAGMVAGALGHTHEEYSVANLARDRSSAAR